MRNKFSEGNRVITTREIIINYRHNLSYTIPKGAAGTILGHSRHIDNCSQYPVCFDTAPNCPNISAGYIVLGNGHYIPTHYLVAVESE